MATASSSPGTNLKLIPPRHALREVPHYNRRRLCELSIFFAENFELNGSRESFNGLALLLARTNHPSFGSMHKAAKFIAENKPPAKVTSLAPDSLMLLMHQTSGCPAFFYSVIKALDNPALLVEGDLVDALHILQSTIAGSSFSTRMRFAGGLSIAMLGNPSCREDWITESNGFHLANIANNLWSGGEFALGFDKVSAALANPELSPERLERIARLTSDRKTMEQALQ